MLFPVFWRPVRFSTYIFRGDPLFPPTRKSSSRTSTQKREEGTTERERERERQSVSARLRHGQARFPGSGRKVAIGITFGLLTLHDCLASPDWNLPPRRIAINQKAKAFCKSSSSWPLCMFDSADVSPPRVPTKEPRLSANLRRPGQFACLTLRNRLQSCPQKTSVFLKTCQVKRQAMHFEVAECFHGGWWVIEQPGR